MSVIMRVASGYAPPASILIHRYPLISDYNDVIGSINLVNANTAFSSSAVYFDATNDYLYTESAVLENADSFTLSVWIKPTAWTGLEYVSVVCLLTDFSDVDIKTVTLHTYNSNGTWYAEYGLKSQRTTESGDAYNSTNWPNTTYQLWLLKYDAASGLSLYKGNTLIKSTGAHSIAAGARRLLLGGNSGSDAQGMGSWYGYYKGRMLDARVYSGALTTDDISNLVSAGPNP